MDSLNNIEGSNFQMLLGDTIQNPDEEGNRAKLLVLRQETKVAEENALRLQNRVRHLEAE